jgi:phospholipid/cholesterol/gamma-HCH transport system ATP-binding protein
MTAKLALQSVCKRFGSKAVLDGLSLEVKTGKSLVVIGGSGTGKSVSLKVLLGLINPDSGKVLIEGEDATRLSTEERDRKAGGFGMLFQGGALFDSLKVWENIAFRLIKAQGVKPAQARDRAIEALASVRLSADTADLRPSELSGGMQKRVALARAVIARPGVIFFDEPTTGLDPITADVINDLIVENVRELGATTLTITHDMASVRKIADEVAMIHAGKIIWRGPVAALDAPDDPRVVQFVRGQAQGPLTR